MSSWTRPVAAIAGITVIVLILMTLSGMAPDLALVAALCLLIGVTVWFVGGIVNGTFDSAPIPTAPVAPPAARGDRRVMRLRSGLSYAHRDDAALVRLRSGLVELIDDQLLTVHQIDRDADPDAARMVIGDELCALIDGTTPVRRLSQPQALGHVLTLIEQI